MKYRALYREARPEVFDEILGQDTIVKILKHQVATETVSHAYLFTGTRGTGKTTTARVLAKALNCLDDDVEKRPCGECENCRAIAEGTFVDVIEIDAASNNGVDNIRELRESVNYPPAVGRKKVYIIDEVHMLSSGAFNALLKTLEEPPENVIFILATTNPEKLPQTILSRCMRLDFRRVGHDVLAGHMKDLCEERGVSVDDDALQLLASSADGSVRDSLSILEQCLSSGEKTLTRDTVLDFLGAASEDFYVRFTGDLMAGDIAGVFMMLDEALADGLDVRQIMKDLMNYFRSILIAKYVEDPEDMINMSSDNIRVVADQARKLGLSAIKESITILAKAVDDSRYSTQPRVLLEVALVDIANVTSGNAEKSSGGSGADPARSIPAGQSVTPERKAETKSAPAPVTVAAEEAHDEKPRDEAAGPEPQGEEKIPTSDAFDAGDQLLDIWRDVVSEAAEKVPMLAILSGIEPVGPKGGELKLPVDTEMAKGMIEKNAALITGLLKRFGVEAKPVCVMAGGAPDDSDGAGNDPEDRVEQIRKQASDGLGVEVRIEE